MTKMFPVEHIDHAIIARPHTPMYLIHKYWARKPHNVVSEYIRRYSMPGEIVLDPFGGSGVTAIEAIKAGRKAISIDLNPLSSFLIENTLSKVSADKIKEAFATIEGNLWTKMNGLYATKCPKCGDAATILASICDREKDLPTELRCICTTCKKFVAVPRQDDLELLSKIEKFPLAWNPKTLLAYNGTGFLKGEGKKAVGDLFTHRSLYALSAIFAEIKKIDDKKLRGVFEFAFTSMVHLASKMCPVAKPGGKGHWSRLSSTSFWALQSFWTPPMYMESNVWMLFKSAVFGKQGILKGKADAEKCVASYKRAKTLPKLTGDANILCATANAMELKKIVPPNSVHYIFTDPPYGGAVQYFEFSTLWASWLGFQLDYTEEITVNGHQEKDFDFYHKMLRLAFGQMYRVLKPNRYLTVTFHSTEIAVWNSIIKAVVTSGFDLEKIVYQPPARPSAKGLLQPYGSAVGDYYIRFRKPAKDAGQADRDISHETYEREVVMAAQRIIEERGEPTIYQRILNGIMVDLKGGRSVPVGAKNIESVLKEHVGKEFALIDVKNAKGKTLGKTWWLRGRDFSNFSTPCLADRVERVILGVLDKKVKASFDEVLQDVFIQFPNALTPDTEGVKSILGEYARKTSDGNWMLKPGEDNRESEHNLMIYHLAELGKKSGHQVWIGLQEQKFQVNDKPLSEMCDSIPVFRGVPQDGVGLDRIKQIDVLWLKEGEIRYEFEVESTTGISEAIIRGSNIPEQLNPKRFIVIPGARERFLFRKLQEPILAETIKNTNWNFIRFSDLEGVVKATKKSFDADKLDAIAWLPKDQKKQKFLL